MAIVYIDSGSFNSLSVTGSFTTTQTIQGTSSFALTASVAPNYVLNNVTSSFATTSSFNSFTSSINGVTGSYITTGSSGVSQTISGSLIINQNLTVLGSSSITYVTSSQLNIGTNLITVNTATPAVRFGGLAVFDSGSTGTGRTGSMLWDSQNDVWIYSNPSGAAYDGALVLMGPRNSTGLGNEVGINSGYAAVGDGSHHMTSSAIYSSGSLIRLENNTQITGSLIVSAGITGSFTGSHIGSLTGTASWASNAVTASYIVTAQTASYVLNAVSSSFASTASLAPNYVLNSATSSFVQNSQTSSFVTNSQTSSFVLNSQTSSMTVATASYVTGSIHTSTNPALSASYALTASYALNAGGSTVSTASLLTTASATNNVITFTKGDASTFTVTVATGSGGGAATFPYTGSAIISGSLIITGSYSQTGSHNIYANQNSVTQADTNGILLGNLSAATVGVQSISPPIVWQGSGWKTTATAGSQDVRFRADILPVQGTTNPSATWQLSSNINNGGYQNPLTYTSNGNLNCGIISAQQQLLGVGGTYNGSSISYYTTNGSGVYAPFMLLGYTTATAGFVSLGYNPDSSQLAFVAGNGTYRVVRASIGITNLVNTAASESGDLIFSTKPGSPANTAVTERLRITSTGNIGIGTTTPNATLDVNGNTIVTGSLNVTGSITQTGSIITSGKFSGGAGYSGGGGVNSNYRFTNAQASDTTDWLFSVYNGPASFGTPAFFIDPTNRFLTFTVSNNANKFIARAGISVETTNQAAGSEDGTLQFFTQTGGANMAERVRISSTGRVGIGTTTPNATLDVNGNTIVTGSLTVSGSTTISNTLTINTLTAGSILYAGASGLLSQNNSELFWNSSNNTFGIGTSATPTSKLHVVAGTLAASTKNYGQYVSATMPTSYAYRPRGAWFDITSAGTQTNNSYPQEGVAVILNAGYTGGSPTRALFAENQAAGTSTGSVVSGAPLGNTGIYFGSVATTTGTNHGVAGFSRYGDISIGGVFRAGFSTTDNFKAGAKYVGAVGIARNDTSAGSVSLGGYFGLNTSDPTYANAALIADNADTTYDIFVARDSGSAVFTIKDSGSVVITGSLTFSSSPTLSPFSGEIVQFGSGTLTAGQLYFLSSSGTWSLANANSTSSSIGMLGIAVGSSPTTNGLLIRGYAYSGSYTTSTGSIVYAATSSGLMTTTSPSSSGHVTRVVGYVTTIPNTIYFDPDKTWVTLA